MTTGTCTCRRGAALERGRGRRPDAAQRELLRAAARRGLGRAPAAGPRRLGPRHRVLADRRRPAGSRWPRPGSTRSPSASRPAPTAPAGAAATCNAAATWDGATRTRRTPTACRSGPARPRRRGPRSSTGPASGAPSSATCPRCWPTRTWTRWARSSAASAPATGCGSTSASPGPTRAPGTGRSAPTASCAGSSRAAASTAPPLHAEHPGLLPYADDCGGLSFRGRPGPRAARARAAGRARGARRPHIAFEEVVNTFFGVEALLASASASSRTAR